MAAIQGLSAAYFLSIMGHQVTVYEKRTQLGGMLRYGIPSYRLPRERLQWDIDAIAAAGVEFKTDYDVQSGRNDSQDQGESRCNPIFPSVPTITKISASQANTPRVLFLP